MNRTQIGKRVLSIRGALSLLLILCLAFAIAPFLTTEAQAADDKMVAMYDFASNFADGAGGSTLYTSGYAPECGRTFSNTAYPSTGFYITSGLADNTYWKWTANGAPGGGFYVDIPQNISSSYTIALRFSFDDIDTSGWDKIIDYKNMGADAGFYFKAQHLQFYSQYIGTKTMYANNIYDLVVTRNGSTNEFSAYIVANGAATREVYFTDSAGEAKPYTTANGHTILHFFHDDGGSEYTSGGKVYSLKIYNYAMTQDQSAKALEGFSVAYNGNGATSGVPTDGKLYTPSDNLVSVSGSVPIRTGYTFAGWLNSVNGQTYTAGSNFYASSNVTLTAQWTANTYYFTYAGMDGAAFGAWHPGSVYYDTTNQFSPPTRPGYAFTGWSVTSGLNTSTARWGTTSAANYSLGATTKCYNGSADIYFRNLTPNVNGSVTLTANWAPITYSIQHSIAAPGGASSVPTGQPSNIIATYNSSYTLRSAPSLAGYAFGGWYTNSGLTDKLGDAGAVVSRNLSATQGALVTLYAKWTPITYNVSYTLGGGTAGAYQPTPITYENTFTVSAPTKTGYTFAGWNVAGGLNVSTACWGTTASSASTRITQNSTLCKNGASGLVYFKNLTATQGGAATLSANWTPNTYAVIYNANKPTGASGSVTGTMANSTHTYDASKALTANAYKLSGWTFKGWATSPTGIVAFTDGDSVKNLTSAAGGSYTLYAVWEKNSYSIIFNAQGGSGGTTKAAVFDSELPDGVATAKNGYVFGGWYTGADGAGTQYYDANGTKLLAKYTVAGTTTLYAKWTPKPYTILYYDGESYVGEQPATYGSYALKAASDFSLTRLHFTFMGWNSYDNQDWAMYQPNRAYTGGLISGDADSAIVYAAWKGVEEYTVTYSANGGAAAPGSEKVYADTPNYSISAAIPTRPGYTFKGWSLDSGAASASYSSGDSITVNGSITLHAVWAEEYAVSYNANGGSGVPAGGSYTKGALVTVSFTALPTRAGYTFAGWATSPDAAAVYTAGGTKTFAMGEADVTLYAVWTANSYTVSFDPGAGSGTMSPQSFTYDEARSLRGIGFTAPSNKNFAGWALSSGGSVVYTDLQSVKNLTTAANGDVTLYAVWSDGQTYYLTYDLNGGSGTTPTSQTGEGVTVSDGTGLSRTGYTFAGWNTRADGTGTPYVASASGVSISANITLFAKWTPITYAVVFHENGEDATGISQNFTYDAEQTLRANTFTSSDGYTFLGWATTPGGAKVYNDEQAVKNLADTTGAKINLYPIWQPTVTTVLLNANGGSGGSSGTSVVYGRAFDGTGLIAPVRYGYVFEGYFLDANADGVKDAAETLWFDDSMAPIEALWNYNKATETLLASWRPVSYTVKFVSGTAELSVSQSVVYGEEFTLKTAEELGINAGLATQHLAGWTTTPASTTVWYTDGQTIATGLTGTDNATVYLYAVFADNGSLTLSYDANGGTGAPLPQSQQVQTNSPALDFVISSTVPTRDNYQFLGWATASDAAAAEYDPEETIRIGAGTTLYAVWRPLSGYAVTYHKNAADTVTGLPDPGVKTEGGGYTISSTIPGRTGYDFLGWNTKADGTGDDYASGAAYADDAALTLYAQWQIRRFAVTPAPSGEGYTVASDSGSLVDYGGSYSFTVTLDAGNAAAGMVVSSNGVALSPVSVSGRTYYYTISNITVAQTVTIAGIGTSTYAVVFLMNDGTDAVYLTRGVTHGSAAVRPSDPVRGGYEFSGWYFGDTLYNFSSAVTGNLNLTAKWTRTATYTVSYDANGGGAAPAPQQKAAGVDLVLSAVKPLRTGWSFVGWGEDRDAAIPAYLSGGAYSADADITLYAIWSQESFDVTLPSGTGYTAEAVNGYESPVSYGGAYRFTVTLESGYSKAGMVVAANGVTLAPIEGTDIYVLENITAAQTVTVTGVAKQRFAVSLPVGEGYTSAGAASAEYGEDYTFTVTLADGYSSSVPTVNNGDTTLDGTKENLVYTYTITAVSEAPAITLTGVAHNAIFTVTYRVDGALYTTQSVEDGQKATQPYAPVKAGYAFSEWSDGESAWTFNEDTVSEETELYAVWTLNSPDVMTPTGYTGEYDGANHLLTLAPTHPAYGVSFAYQWYFGSVSDGNEVGTDSASISVKHVADAGDYFCVVTASDGTLTSEAAATAAITVSITPATPRITLADKSAIVGAGTDIGPATVTGVSGETPSGTVTYHYYSDAACTELLSEAPTTVGTYYAKAAIAPDGNYTSATSAAAKLTISPDGGGIGGGGGAPAAATIPVASGNDAPVQNTYTLDGGEAKLDYDEDVLSKVVFAAEGSGTVTIDASAVEAVQSVSLPAGVVSTISRSDAVRELTVKTPAADITLDAAALKTINDSFDSSYDAVAVKAAPVAAVQLTEAQREVIEENHNAVIIDLSATLTHYNASGNITGRESIHDLGGSATVSFAYELAEGQNPDAIRVYYISENGQTESLDAVYAKGVVTVVTTHFSTYVVEYCPMSVFSDCALSNWYHEDVDYAVASGLMQGTSAVTFDPNGTTTRGMIVTILYRLEGESAVTGACPFDDVASGKYYEDAISWAAANKIVDGYGDGKFGPEDPITREQMAAILWRYAKYKGCDVSAAADLSSFIDGSSISNYALTAMQWANASGLVTGKGGGILDPLGSAERCQVAAILHRFCDNLAR